MGGRFDYGALRGQLEAMAGRTKLMSAAQQAGPLPPPAVLLGGPQEPWHDLQEFAKVGRQGRAGGNNPQP